MNNINLSKHITLLIDCYLFNYKYDLLYSVINNIDFFNKGWDLLIYLILFLWEVVNQICNQLNLKPLAKKLKPSTEPISNIQNKFKSLSAQWIPFLNNKTPPPLKVHFKQLVKLILRIGMNLR